MAHNRCLRWGWKEGREPRHNQSPSHARPSFMCSKDTPASCPLLAALRRTFLSCSSHIPEGWGLTIWGRVALAVSGQSSNTFPFLGMISMIWGLGFFCGEEPQRKVKIQCQLKFRLQTPMILSFTQALSHGFMSFMTSEWIWVIFRFWVHAVKEKLSRVCLTHRKPCGVVSPTAIFSSV